MLRIDFSSKSPLNHIRVAVSQFAVCQLFPSVYGLLLHEKNLTLFKLHLFYRVLTTLNGGLRIKFVYKSMPSTVVVFLHSYISLKSINLLLVFYICQCIHPFNKYLLNAYFVSGTIQRGWETSLNKPDKIPDFIELIFCWRKDINNKYNT